MMVESKAEAAMKKALEVMNRRPAVIARSQAAGFRYSCSLEFFALEGILFANVKSRQFEQVRYTRDLHKKASELVLSAPYRFVYCEGVVIENGGLAIPCTRPWVWDRFEQVAFDIGGGRLADEYFGVPFRFEWLRSQVLNRGVFGVWDSPKLLSQSPGDYWEDRLERLPEAK